jgi:hypothetical protein
MILATIFLEKSMVIRQHRQCILQNSIEITVEENGAVQRVLHGGKYNIIKYVMNNDEITDSRKYDV